MHQGWTCSHYSEKNNAKEYIFDSLWTIKSYFHFIDVVLFYKKFVIYSAVNLEGVQEEILIKEVYPFLMEVLLFSKFVLV